MSLWSVPTLLAVALGLGIAVGARDAGDADLAGPIFGANATLVALILPAAALANGFLEGRMLDYLTRLFKSDERHDRISVADSIVQHFDEVKGALAPLLRGFVLLVISLALSIGALFRSTSHLWSSGPSWLHLRVQDLLEGGALGLDVIGILLLFPFAWLLLDTKLTDQTSKFMHAYVEQMRASPETNPVAADGTAVAPVGRSLSQDPPPDAPDS
jgi:hypothetical protein